MRLGAVAVVAIAAAAGYATGWDSPVRAGLVLAFLLFGPGLAIAEVLDIRDPVQQIGIAVGVSLAVDTIASVTLLYTGLFSAELAFAVIVAVTFAAIIVAVLRALRGSLIADSHSGRAAT